MSEQNIKIPDIGDAEAVEIIEISVAVGDSVEENDTLLVLESDKASMEVPSPMAGEVTGLLVKVGDKVSEGDDIVVLKTSAEALEPEASAPSTDDSPADEPPAPAAEPEAPAAATGAAQVVDISVPDLGDTDEVEVIEVSVATGDEIAENDTLIVLESDKASMEVPAVDAGVIESLTVKVGDKVSAGTVIGQLKTTAAASAAPAAPAQAEAAPSQSPAPAAAPSKTSVQKPSNNLPGTVSTYRAGEKVYAGPAVRMLARDLGVDLTKVPATGPKDRILKEDVEAYVKNLMNQVQSGQLTEGDGGSAIPPIPEIDFSQFGEIETVPMTRVQKLTAANMVRSWLNVPHVSHFDEADISDLEEFRAENRDIAKEKGMKLTFLPFLLKASAACLIRYPQFNVSLASDGENLIQKKYVHIGVAMDTPLGLMVPVIKDVDKKGIWELAEEMTSLTVKARDKQFRKEDLQGACFTISSLGGIGGTGFTPIVNAPEVAILGVSRTQIKPVYIDNQFEPRSMLPLCLSYDHRAINGVDAGNFMTFLTQLLEDIRKLIM